VADLAGRMDALWRLIAAVVEQAGISVPDATSPPAEFARALAAPGGAGHRSVRLSIDGQEWIAAISPEERPADLAGAWAALERIAKAADPGEPADPAEPGR
jgi:hypothetical protein